MTIDTFYVFFDLTIIGLVCYVTHLLRCIARNTYKPTERDIAKEAARLARQASRKPNKDLFQP